MITWHSAITGAVEGGTASVTFTVAENCTVTVSFVSYKAPSAEFDENTANQQTVFAHVTVTFTGGTHTLTIPVPSFNEYENVIEPGGLTRFYLDPVTFELGLRKLRNNLAAAPGMDNKVGAWTVMSALQLVARMTEQAAAWSEHDLDRRFDLGEPHDELTQLGTTLASFLARVVEPFGIDLADHDELAGQIQAQARAALNERSRSPACRQWSAHAQRRDVGVPPLRVSCCNTVPARRCKKARGVFARPFKAAVASRSWRIVTLPGVSVDSSSSACNIPATLSS